MDLTAAVADLFRSLDFPRLALVVIALGLGVVALSLYTVIVALRKGKE